MIIDTAYVTETIRITREVQAARDDLAANPSYGRALAVQRSRKIRDERVKVSRSSLRLVEGLGDE